MVSCAMSLAAFGAIQLVFILSLQGAQSAPAEGDAEERVQNILKSQPLLDGHNDHPLNLRVHLYNILTSFNFNSDLKENKEWMAVKPLETHTDIPRLRAGGVGIQFWAAYTDCASQYKDSVEQTLEQIDVIKRLVKKNEDNLQFATCTKGIEDALKNGKIASLIGVEGGHSIQSSLAILRTLYELGARYLTLTHNCNTPWADSAVTDNKTGSLKPINGGISPFGLKVIEEMNRLGMIVDLSHTTKEAQKMALAHSKAPVMYSHSSSFTICPHFRNVHDDVLKLVAETKSVVLINFYSAFVKCDGTRGTLADVIEHIEQVRKEAGIDNIGIGSDFDGVDILPEGLSDVSKFPDLLKALIETGRWSDEDIEKFIGKNMLRVLGDVEKVRDSLKDMEPVDDVITRADLKKKKADVSAITANFPGDKLPLS